MSEKENRGRKPLGKLKRTLTIKVSVNEKEQKQIERRAKKAGLSVAVYLRNAGLGIT